MRRSLLTTMGAIAFVLALPSVALAHHGHHHHRFRAKTHHAKFRLMDIGEDAARAHGPPPASLSPAMPEIAGTVASYMNDVLTLTLSDGSAISGKVTSDTRTCDTSLLVPGAVVRGAELSIGPGGGEFESIWLAR